MLPSYLRKERATLERICRWHCQTARLNDRLLICRVLGKYIMYADPEDVSITPHLCLDGFWESWITIVLARTLQPGWCCVDVGANHGYYTLLMADAVGSGGRVLAVEPQPQLTELLRFTLEVNGFHHQAAVLQKAVSDTVSRQTHLVVPRHRGPDATLDQLTADWPRVNLIKIDAEGAEESIWRGMRQTLERHQDITVIMEMRCARYANPQAFVREILQSGFLLRHIDYDATIKNLTVEQILTDRQAEDWMLFLHRE